MIQSSLFDADRQVLLDDEHGRIVLAATVVPSERLARWFAELQTGVSWKEGNRLMYDREVAVPRLRAYYNVGDADVPGVLHEGLAAVRQVVDAPFDSIGLNLYRDERDSVAPHNDSLSELVRGEPIAVLSLGATRRMTIRAKRMPRRVLHVDLESGSVLVMSWETQRHFDHGIPKQRERCGPRISLAFRVRGTASRAVQGDRT
jgi:alkylated DNA repair dioxygenase AlkB